MKKNQHPADVMSTQEAATLLGVSMRTAQLWVESGVLPAWKTAGGHRRIARAAVERLVAERQAAIDPPATEAPVPPAQRPLVVLVVEDEPDLLRLFTLVIQGWGLPIELHTASNGFEALLRMGERHPDMMITDLNMPGMDGFRMLRFLHSLSAGRNPIDIIVVTALGRDDIEDRGGLPADIPVFTKPVPFSVLEKRVRDRLATQAASIPS